MNDRQIRRFCRRIAAKCPRAFRSRLTGELKAHIADFLQEHPDADEAAVTAHIGQPEEYAAAFVDSMSETESRSLLRRRRFVQIISVILIILVLLAAGWGIYHAILFKKEGKMMFYKIYTSGQLTKSAWVTPDGEYVSYESRPTTAPTTQEAGSAVDG